jgi:REP element-mobilizing transposase RayT
MNNKPKYNPQIHHRRSIRLKGYDYSQAGLYFITICCEDRECRFGNIVGASLADAQMADTQMADAHMELNEYGIIAYNEWIKLPERFSNFELDVFQIMPNHMHGIILLNDAVGAGFTPAQNNAGFTPAQNNAGFTPAQNNVGFTSAQNNAGFTHAQNNAGFTHAQNNAGFTSAQNNAGFTSAQNNNVHLNTGQPQGLPLRVSGDDNVAGVNPARTTNATIGDIVGAYKSLVANACLVIFKSKNETMGKLWQRNYYEHIIRNERSYQTISEYIINNPAKWMDDKFFK